MSDTDDTEAIPEITLAELLGDDDAQSPVNEMIGVKKNSMKKLMEERRKPFKSDAQKRAEGYEKIAKEEAKAKKANSKRKKINDGAQMKALAMFHPISVVISCQMALVETDTILPREYPCGRMRRPILSDLI